MSDNSFHLSADGSVLYNSSVDIAGFQFSVDGTTVGGASGGDAAAAGFTVSAGGSTVLGFSFTGATIASGCGTLTNLSLNGDATGLSGIVVSDATGSGVDFTYFDGSGGGDDCPSGIYDCAGVCDGDAVEDCAGDCGGIADFDDCGVCNGGNQDQDCAGVCFGDAVIDDCGVCDGPGYFMCGDGSMVCDESDCPIGGDWDGNALSLIHI